MAGTLLIGYDVEGLIKEIRELWGKEYPDPKAVTRIFLARAADVHRRYKAPCTLFVLGQVLEENIIHFQELLRHRSRVMGCHKRYVHEKRVRGVPFLNKAD